MIGANKKKKKNEKKTNNSQRPSGEKFSTEVSCRGVEKKFVQGSCWLPRVKTCIRPGAREDAVIQRLGSRSCTTRQASNTSDKVHLRHYLHTPQLSQREQCSTCFMKYLEKVH